MVVCVCGFSGQGGVHGRQLWPPCRGTRVHDPGGRSSQGPDGPWPIPHQVLLHRRRQVQPPVLGVEPPHQEGLERVDERETDR